MSRLKRKTLKYLGNIASANLRTTADIKSNIVGLQVKEAFITTMLKLQEALN